MEILAEFGFDTGTVNVGRVGMRVHDTYFEALITAFGGIQREIGLVPSDFRSSSVSITVSNVDGRFSRLRAQGSWRNRLVRVFLIDPDEGLSSLQIAFVGRIEKWSITNLECTIDAVDAIAQRLTRPLSYVLDSGFFSNIPDQTPRALVPLVIGAVTAPGGAVPAYLVNPAVGITPYRYVACQGRAGDISEVYSYGVLVDSADYDISYGTGPAGTEVTFIDFDSDPRIGGDTTEPHVSWNGSGITDDDTETGNPITNAAEQLVKVLRINGFAANEIDASTVALAADALTSQQITGAFVATDQQLTIGDVVRQFAESFNLQLFATRNGLIGMTAPVISVDEEAELPEVTALEDVVRDSFIVSGPDEVAATLQAEYGFNWFTGGFLSKLDRTNPAQVSALGENVILSSAHPFVRSNESITAVADAKLFFLREQRQVVRVMVPATWHQRLEVGELVRLTHFSGPAEFEP